MGEKPFIWGTEPLNREKLHKNAIHMGHKPLNMGENPLIWGINPLNRGENPLIWGTEPFKIGKPHRNPFRCGNPIKIPNPPPS